MAVVVATSVVSGCGTGPSLLCLHSAVASRVCAPGSGVITNKARATFGGCCFSKSRQFSARQLLPSFQIPIESAARETISTEFSPRFCTCCSSHSRKSPVTYFGLFDRSFFGLLSSSLQLSSSSQNQRKSTVGFAATAMDATEKRKKVLVPVANGTEEMEAVILIDVLRRAGADVTVASVEEEQHHIVAANGVVIVADALISECEGQEFDLVALPGGMPGSERLRDSKTLQQITKKQAESCQPYAAICAAPVVALQSWGLLKGLHATCHPSFADQLESAETAGSRVVKDNGLTTSQGPGSAFEFALSLTQQLYDHEKLALVRGPMVLPSNDGKESGKILFNEQKWPSNGVPHVLVPVANGSEEMEVVIIVDILRRAGATVVVASVEEETTIVASRKVKLVADQLLSDIHETKFDLILLPGGMPGAERLQKSETLLNMLKDQVEGERVHGAICAAPAVVLQSHDLLQGKKATCHPGFTDKLKDQTAVEGRVVIDGLLVTSRGPGTAMEFALAIVEKLFGSKKAKELVSHLVIDE